MERLRREGGVRREMEEGGRERLHMHNGENGGRGGEKESDGRSGGSTVFGTYGLKLHPSMFGR